MGMTSRARAYLGLAALRNLGLGLVCLLAPASFAQSTITDVLPLAVWAVLFFIGSIHLFAAATLGRETWARVALIVSAACAAAWGTSFLLAQTANPSYGWVAPILWFGLAAADLVVTRQPLRTPFEDLVDALADGG